MVPPDPHAITATPQAGTLADHTNETEFTLNPIRAHLRHLRASPRSHPCPPSQERNDAPRSRCNPFLPDPRRNGPHVPSPGRNCADVVCSTDPRGSRRPASARSPHTTLAAGPAPERAVFFARTNPKNRVVAPENAVRVASFHANEPTPYQPARPRQTAKRRCHTVRHGDRTLRRRRLIPPSSRSISSSCEACGRPVRWDGCSPSGRGRRNSCDPSPSR